MVIKINEKVTDDYKTWAGYHGIEIIDIKGQLYAKINNTCSKLINGLCSIQDNKPRLCKEFDCEQEGFKEFKILL